jgi:hypothetical protein
VLRETVIDTRRLLVRYSRRNQRKKIWMVGGQTHYAAWNVRSDGNADFSSLFLKASHKMNLHTSYSVIHKVAC